MGELDGFAFPTSDRVLSGDVPATAGCTGEAESAGVCSSRVTTTRFRARQRGQRSGATEATRTRIRSLQRGQLSIAPTSRRGAVPR
jgi:hypothetical protein